MNDVNGIFGMLLLLIKSFTYSSLSIFTVWIQWNRINSAQAFFGSMQRGRINDTKKGGHHTAIAQINAMHFNLCQPNEFGFQIRFKIIITAVCIGIWFSPVSISHSLFFAVSSLMLFPRYKEVILRTDKWINSKRIARFCVHRKRSPWTATNCACHSIEVKCDQFNWHTRKQLLCEFLM